MSRRRLVPRRFYARDPTLVAPELLHKVLAGPNGAGRIVEVEAYDGANDPGSHAYRGRTPRTTVMFGPPGHLYVYFSYGVHWCANAVCRTNGVAGAVLIRALAPIDGIAQMRAVRSAARLDRDLCNGPGKLCEALGIDRRHNGADLTHRTSGGVVIVDDGTDPPAVPIQTTRVGLRLGGELAWRWYVAGDPHVSRR
ncbi:MAG TPA: DNA-3-methyladenine glycosylase [Acidimicrobiales bacterium]|nr:DNA-3-methyladenine glycosylase [Acidimicrobiales bacterium]